MLPEKSWEEWWKGASPGADELEVTLRTAAVQPHFSNHPVPRTDGVKICCQNMHLSEHAGEILEGTARLQHLHASSSAAIYILTCKLCAAVTPRSGRSGSPAKIPSWPEQTPVVKTSDAASEERGPYWSLKLQEKKCLLGKKGHNLHSTNPQQHITLQSLGNVIAV